MWLRAAGYWGYQYKRTWRSSVVTSFLIPVLYLAAMGVALGSLIDKHSHGVDGVTYVAFLAPGPAGRHVHADRHQRRHVPGHGGDQVDAHLPRPAGRRRSSVYDVLLGHLAWIAARLAIVVSIYLAVMAAFGVVYSPWAHPRPARRRADRHGVRRARQRLRRHPGQGLLVLDAVPLRHHPDVPVLGHLLPDLAAAGVAPGRGLRARRSTTASRCAATSRSARWAGPTSGTRPTSARCVAVGYAAGRRTFAERLVV